MTNEEMLERLKKCFTNFRFPGGYQELALTNEKELNSLVIDLLKDVRREKTEKRLIRLAMNSTYGKYGSVITGGYYINTLADTNIKDRIKMLESLLATELDVPDLYPSVALFSKPATFKVDDYFTKHYIINDGKIITKKAVVLGPSKTNGRNIESVTVDKYCANDVKFMERIISKDIKPKVMFNGPATIFQYGDFKTVVKCDEEDEFDRLVGLGVALYRYYRQHINYKKQYQTLSYFMDLDELAHYALHQFCDHSVNKKGNLAKELKKHDEGTWITLDI